MATISTMDALKKIPTNGITSLVAGIMSATTNIKTVIANSNVIANEIRSPTRQMVNSKMVNIFENHLSFLLFSFCLYKEIYFFLDTSSNLIVFL